MISLKIKKYRPYADVTMVVNEDVEIHLGMLDEKQLDRLATQFACLVLQIGLLLGEYAKDE